MAARYEKALLGLARGILDERSDAACDAVQDAWVRVIRSAHTFDGRSAFRTWVYRVVINACKDQRARRLRLAGTVETGAGHGSGQAAMSGRDSGSSIDRVNNGSDEIRGAFADLPPDRRLLLLLCYHHGLTHPQAAAVLGIPIGTLKSRLNAALTDLRARMREEALP